MPMPPSRMLMFTSISKHVMSSPDKSALAKGMSVGSVVRISSFITMT